MKQTFKIYVFQIVTKRKHSHRTELFLAPSLVNLCWGPLCKGPFTLNDSDMSDDILDKGVVAFIPIKIFTWEDNDKKSSGMGCRSM